MEMRKDQVHPEKAKWSSNRTLNNSYHLKSHKKFSLVIHQTQLKRNRKLSLDEGIKKIVG
jgi:hypothetical protein